MRMLQNLAGKTALITGGSRGIGRATALEFARAGANVAFTYEKNRDAAASLEGELARLGVRTFSQAVDVTREEQMAGFVEAVVQTFGSLDIAIANAGIWKEVKIERMSLAEFRETMEINMTGSMLLAKHVAQRMIPQKSGAIVL